MRAVITGASHCIASDWSEEENKKLRTLFSPAALRRVPFAIKMGLGVAVQAFGFPSRSLSPDMGLMIASSFPCQETSCNFMDSILDDGPRLASPLSFSHSVNNAAAGILSQLLGIEGPCVTVNTQDASFLSMIELAETMLFAKRVEKLLVGVIEEKDERLQKVFPERNFVAGSVFFVLEGQEEASTACIDLNWRGGEKESLLKEKKAEQTPSPLEQALFCSKAWAAAQTKQILVADALQDMRVLLKLS